MSYRPEDLLRRLGRRYAVVLVVVAAVLLVDQAILQPMLSRLNLAAPVINLAGRQRMLSQRIVKDALTLSLQPDAVDQLEPALQATLAEWQRVHLALRSGNLELQFPTPEDPETAAS